MKKRLENKVFLFTLFGLVYQLHNYLALQLNFPTVDNETYKLVINLICYAIIGTGVYSTFENKGDE